MAQPNDRSDEYDRQGRSGAIEILFFKSKFCVFCPAAEKVLCDMAQLMGSIIKIHTIDVIEQPDYAEKYGVLSIPTIIIGGLSVTGIPERETIMNMILKSMRDVLSRSSVVR